MTIDIKKWEKLLPADKAKILVRILPQEKVEGLEESRKKLEELTKLLEVKVNDLASNLPQELLEGLEKSRKELEELTRLLEHKVNDLVSILPQEKVEGLEKSRKELEELMELLEEKLKASYKLLPTRSLKITITQNQIETTIRLLKEKVSIEYISQVTGLTQGQINAFKTN